MLKQFIATLISFFLASHFVIAQSPSIVLDSLEDRMVLLYLYNAQDFTDNGIALWIPDSVKSLHHPNAVNRKVSYTKIFSTHYSQNQCVIFFATLNVKDYTTQVGSGYKPQNYFNTRLEYMDVDYFDKAVFVKNHANQWTIQSFHESIMDSPSDTIQVKWISDLSSKNILTSLYHTELLTDSVGLYRFNDTEVNDAIVLYAKKYAKIYFKKTLYYQNDNKDYALVITSFEPVWCHACSAIANLALFEKDTISSNWKLLKDHRYWDANTSYGRSPDLEITSIKINGIDKKVIFHYSDDWGTGGDYSFDVFYSLEGNFEKLFSYQSSHSNGGHEFNDNIEHLLKMDYHNENVYMQDTAGYDFKLVYHENGIYQKTEFYNGFKVEKTCTCLAENEDLIDTYQRYLWIDHLFADAVYTFEYLSEYSGIPLEIFQFLNETPPSKEDPTFLTPFYLHEYFHLLFDKNKNFDLEKISKEYNVSIEQIQRINKYNYYQEDKYKDHFLLVPKKN